MEEEDQITRLLGNFGKWQFLVLLPIAMRETFTSWHILSTSFLALEGDYWCSSQSMLSNNNVSSFPLKNNTAGDECNFYSENETLEACTEWTYDTSEFSSSIVTDFNLVCNRRILVTVAQIVYMFGVLCGAVGSGLISDRIGRRMTMLVAMIGNVIFGFAVSAACSLETFVALRFLVAVTATAAWTTGYGYAMEFVGGNWKTWIGIGLEFPWAAGYAILPGIAYRLRDWKYLQLAISSPGILFVVFFWCVPESPRWLLANGRVEEAQVILEKALKFNGKVWPKEFKLTETSHAGEDKQTSKLDDDHRATTYFDLFRTPNLRRNTLIQYFNWFTASFVYYGLTLNSGSLIPGDTYVNFFVSAIIEIPAYTLCLVILYYCGRKYPLSFMYFLGGIALLLTLAMPEGTAVLTMAMVGKFGIICAFAIIYVQAAEIYPTVVRNTGLGSSSMCARIGSMLAPVIARELGNAGSTVPIVVFAISSLIAGFNTLWLPETNGKKLPDSIEEAESFGDSNGCFSVLCNRKRVNI